MNADKRRYNRTFTLMIPLYLRSSAFICGEMTAV
jgi:hypothetical protein